MRFADLFNNSLIDALNHGSIGFGEPDLTKIFVSMIHISFRNGVYSTGKLTQSQKKWFASKTKNGPKKEIGDFILFSKKNKEFKMAFIQAKSIKKPNSSLDSVTGNVFQHWLMSGKSKNIFLMGKTPFTFFGDKKSKNSISNYLVFYRYNETLFNSCKYEAYLSSVKGGIRLCKKSTTTFNKFCKIGCRNKFHEKHVTFGRKYHNYHLPDDCLCATSFKNILKEIASFRVGQKVTPTIIKSLEPYISKEVIEILKSNNDNFIPIHRADDNSQYPILVVDTERFDQEIIFD